MYPRVHKCVFARSLLANFLTSEFRDYFSNAFLYVSRTYICPFVDAVIIFRQGNRALCAKHVLRLKRAVMVFKKPYCALNYYYNVIITIIRESENSRPETRK